MRRGGPGAEEHSMKVVWWLITPLAAEPLSLKIRRTADSQTDGERMAGIIIILYQVLAA